MSLGFLTKQLAQQAIGNQVKEVVDSLRPADAAATAESLGGSKPTAAQGESAGSIIIAQMQAMQNALKDDQELVVLCGTALEPMRVLEVYAPSWRVAVLTGIDSAKVLTRLISPFDSLQLVCKPMAVQPGAKPARIRFITPKAG
jgi:hypothetical protein